MASGSSAVALLVLVASAGCLAPSGSEMPDTDIDIPLDQPLPGAHRVVVRAMPGLVLAGDVSHEGNHHAISVAARNEGTRTYFVKAEDCGGWPWHDTMSHDGEPVRHREHTASCDICSSREFAPGEAIRASFEWDELVWEGGYGPDPATHEDAAAGGYSWTAHLRVREEPGCNEYEPSAALSFDFLVG